MKQMYYTYSMPSIFLTFRPGSAGCHYDLTGNEMLRLHLGTGIFIHNINNVAVSLLRKIVMLV